MHLRVLTMTSLCLPLLAHLGAGQPAGEPKPGMESKATSAPSPVFLPLGVIRNLSKEKTWLSNPGPDIRFIRAAAGTAPRACFENQIVPCSPGTELQIEATQAFLEAGRRFDVAMAQNRSVVASLNFCPDLAGGHLLELSPFYDRYLAGADAPKEWFQLTGATLTLLPPGLEVQAVAVEETKGLGAGAATVAAKGAAPAVAGSAVVARQLDRQAALIKQTIEAWRKQDPDRPINLIIGANARE